MAKNFISDLSTTAASNTDIVGQDVQGSANVSGGDNALRNLAQLLAKFYDDLGGVNTVGGTGDAITVTAAQAWTAYGSGDGLIGTGTVLAFKAGAANTGAATINVNAIGVKKIRLQGDSALGANAIVSGGTYILKYDAAYDTAAGAWVLLNPGASADYVDVIGDTMTGRLAINFNAASLPGNISSLLQLSGVDGSSDTILMDAYGATNLIVGRRATNTKASPTAVVNGDVLFNTAGRGYGATGYSSTDRAAFRFMSAETWTDAAQGTKMDVRLTPIGSTTLGTVFAIADTGAVTSTSTATSVFTATTSPLRTVNTADSGGNQVARFDSDRATPANSDQAYVAVYLSNGSGTQTECYRVNVQIDDTTAGSEDSSIYEAIMVAGTVTYKTGLNNTAFYPYTTDTLALGTTSNMWSDLFLASGGVINWNNGDVTLTHATDMITLGGGSFSRGAPVTKTGDFTLAANENWVINNRAATNTVTLPSAASFTGREVTMSTIQAQTVVSASSNVVPRTGGSAGTAILPATDGAWATLVSDGTNWIIMAGSP